MTFLLPRKILVAVDGSEPSLHAAAYATKLAAVARADVLALHVILLPFGASTNVVEALRGQLAARAATILREVQAVGAPEGIILSTKTAETDRSVVDAIVEAAKAWGAELVVVGTRGTSGMGKLMLGSVAAGVVSGALCPVLAVR